MKKLTRSLVVSLLSAITVASAAPVTLEELTDPAGMSFATLSPDGRHIAAILYNGTNHGLILIDTDPKGQQDRRRRV